MQKPFFLASAAIVALSGAASAQNITPNSERYADSRPDAIGHAGAATLSVRALLDKAGTTHVEVTAGRTDGNPAGTLARLLFRAYDAQERVAWSRSVTSIGASTYQTTFTGMTRGQPMQTQATVRSADGRRNDVVITSSNVRLRPDLAIDSIEAPAQYEAGQPTPITAIVREANGDTGASAACRLLINGTEVDQAQGVWIDAAGVVACSFRHTFDVPGSYNMEVAVDGVAPADWDLANNRGQRSIEITGSRSEGFDWIGWAHNVSGTSSYSNRGCYVTVDGSCPTFDFETYQAQVIKWQFAFISGLSRAPIQFPITVTFSGTADGTLFADEQHEAVAPNWSWDDGWQVEQSYNVIDYRTGMTYSVGNRSLGGDFRSHITAQRLAQDIVYYSGEAARELFAYDGPNYFHADMRDVIGEFWPMTGSVSMNLVATDGASHTWTAATSFMMSPQREEYDQSYCEPTVSMAGTGLSCQSWKGYTEGVNGYQWGSTP